MLPAHRRDRQDSSGLHWFLKSGRACRVAERTQGSTGMRLPVPRDAGAAESTGVRPLPFWEGPPTPTPATRVAERAVGSICSLGGLLL